MGIHSNAPRQGDVQAAEHWLFRIRSEQYELRPPIDWADEPYADRDGRAFLQNSFTFADPLLRAETTEESRRRVLSSLAAIFLDWIDQNPLQDPAKQHRYAWYDHAAAARLVHIAYLLREGSRRHLLEQEQKQALARSVVEHVDFLLADENYQPGHNHGLFSDAALKLAADSLPFGPECQEWAAIASERFRRVVGRTIELSEGVHLEHSTHYQLVIRGALKRFKPAKLIPESELEALLERMEQATIWLTGPDGALPPVGDTSSGEKPSAAIQEAASSVRGLKAFPRSGYCVVRDGGSYLFVTACFHSPAHKHADDLSYCLYENGRMLVGDSGNAGYDYASPARQYCVSPRAHSSVAIDSYSWIDDPRGGHGSGLVATGAGSGWYAILAENPRIAPDERVARRLFLYRPRIALAVIDEVSALEEETVERYLPLAPELSVTKMAPDTVSIDREEDHKARVAVLVPVTGNANPDSISAVRGQLNHPMGGVLFPTLNESQARTTLMLSRRGGGLSGYVLAIDGETADDSPSATAATGSLAGARAEVTVTGVGNATLNVRLENEGSLQLAALPSG